MDEIIFSVYTPKKAIEMIETSILYESQSFAHCHLLMLDSTIAW